GDRARLGRHQAFDVTWIASPRIYDRRDGRARQRSADWNRGSILDPAGFQWQRRNFLRAVRRSKRSDTKIELARHGISWRVFTRRTVGSFGRVRCEMEGFILRTGLPASLDQPHRQ